LQISNLEELIEQQGVLATADLDEISALGPAGDDPDEPLDHILLERSERRKLQSSRRWFFVGTVLLDTSVASLLHLKKKRSTLRAQYEPHMRGQVLVGF
jgi:hypothetical protein